MPQPLFFFGTFPAHGVAVDRLRVAQLASSAGDVLSFLDTAWAGAEDYRLFDGAPIVHTREESLP
jgi:hypothetical protein